MIETEEESPPIDYRKLLISRLNEEASRLNRRYRELQQELMVVAHQRQALLEPGDAVVENPDLAALPADPDELQPAPRHLGHQLGLLGGLTDVERDAGVPEVAVQRGEDGRDVHVDDIARLQFVEGDGA